MDLLTRTLSTTTACLPAPGHRAFAGCESDLEIFHVAEKAGVKHFAKAALDAVVHVRLSEETAETTVKVACLVPEVAAESLLGFALDAILLYQCIN